LTVTLPPPTVTNGEVNEGAYNWAALGAAADLLQIQPLRDQDVYRDDMPVILDYITARVPAGRVALTVTPYATEKSGEGLRPLKLADAMATATQLSVVGSELAPNENVEIVGTNVDQTEGLS